MDENNLFNGENEDNLDQNPLENDNGKFNSNPEPDNFENSNPIEDEESFQDNKNGAEEPTNHWMPPNMPIVEEKPYQPIDSSGAEKGIKLFAVLLAILVAISASVTAGYFWGRSTNKAGTTSKYVPIDLASKPTPENAKTTSQVFNEVNPSIVGIYVHNEEKVLGTASGVVYTKDGYIITNDHIYANTPNAQFMIYTWDGKMYSAKYVAGDVESDLAVLKIDGVDDLKPAVLGNSLQVATGETVIAIGRPNGADTSSVVTEGVVSSTSSRVRTTSNYSNKLIQTDTAINPGNSGGALCNIYGQVIGITSAKLIGNVYEDVSYAIPTVTVKKIIDSLIEHKTVKGRARLGITYNFIDELSGQINSLPSGLVVGEISEDSDLYGKIVKTNDIITHINETKITSPDLVLDIIEESEPGQTVSLRVYSLTDNKSYDITVKLLEDNGSSSYKTSNQ